jgi:hypothetical protein
LPRPIKPIGVSASAFTQFTITAPTFSLFTPGKHSADDPNADRLTIAEAEDRVGQARRRQ